MPSQYVVQARRADGSLPPVRVAILIPAYDHAPAAFAWDYGNLMLYSTAKLMMLGRVALLPIYNEQTYIEENRTALVRAALDNDCTHALWLDTDMRFPPNALERLLARDRAIVGANYRQRRGTHLPTAFTTIELLVYCVTHPGSTGIERVESASMGVMLTHLDVFRQIPEPWFTERAWGEHRVRDCLAFCVGAREAGFPIYVDHDLSHDVRHIGTEEYGWEETTT